MDEAALALGIINHDITGLFGRLDYGQVAPFGFRLAVKACAVVFGESEWSLRLFPFLCGLAALPVFYFLAGRLLPRPAAAVATVLFSLATPVAVYSALLKPYSSDVLFALIVLAATHHLISSTGDRSRLVLTAGVFAAFFSQPALLVLAACGVVVLIDALRHNRRLRPRLIVVTVWAAAVLANVWWNLGIMRAADRAYMLRFWEPFFMPLEWPAAVQWLWLRFYDLIVDGPWPNGSLLYQMPKLWAVLIAVRRHSLVAARHLRPPAAGATDYCCGGSSRRRVPAWPIEPVSSLYRSFCCWPFPVHGNSSRGPTPERQPSRRFC